MAQAKDNEIQLKVKVVGDPSVGKSSLILRFADNTYTESYISGVDSKVREMEIDGRNVKLQIFDATAQEGFKNLQGIWRSKANILMVCYDPTDQASFDNVKNWVSENDRVDNECPIKVLVATKSDLGSQKVIDDQTAKDFADEIGMKFISTSAKSRVNVEEAFTDAAQSAIKEMRLPKTPKQQMKEEITDMIDQIEKAMKPKMFEKLPIIKSLAKVAIKRAHEQSVERVMKEIRPRIKEIYQQHGTSDGLGKESPEIARKESERRDQSDTRLSAAKTLYAHFLSIRDDVQAEQRQEKSSSGPSVA